MFSHGNRKRREPPTGTARSYLLVTHGLNVRKQPRDLWILCFLLAEIREAFRVLDRDGNGFISKQELGMAMRSLGYMPSEVELAIIMQRLDMDGKTCLARLCLPPHSLGLGFQQVSGSKPELGLHARNRNLNSVWVCSTGLCELQRPAWMVWGQLIGMDEANVVGGAARPLLPLPSIFFYHFQGWRAQWLRSHILLLRIGFEHPCWVAQPSRTPAPGGI